MTEKTDLNAFLDSKARQGHFESRGKFTLDIARGLRLVEALSLPSRSHYLLKFVQVANRVGARALKIKVAARQTRIEFQTDRPGALAHPRDLMQALAQPLQGRGLLSDVALAILGGLHPNTRSVEWRLQRGSAGYTIGIDGRRRLHFASKGQGREGEATSRIIFTAKNRNWWSFWATPRRRLEVRVLLNNLGCFGTTPVLLADGPLEPPSAAMLNKHLRETVLGRFYPVTGMQESIQTTSAATSLVLQLAESRSEAFAMRTPSHEEYRFLKDTNVWYPSEEMPRIVAEHCPAWLVQFRGRRQSLPLSNADDSVHLQAALALNLHGPGSSDDVRVMVVRHGVLVLSTKVLPEQDLDEFKGCVLLFAEDSLETDPTGLQLIQNQALQTRLKEFRHLVDRAHKVVDNCQDELGHSGLAL